MFVLVFLASIPLFAQNPNDPEALKNAGVAAMTQGDADKAAGLFEKAVQLRPNVAEYHYLLGQAYGDQAQNASLFSKASLAGKCRDEFLKAVELDPNNINARFALIDYFTIAPSMMGGSEEKALQQAAEIRKRDAL